MDLANFLASPRTSSTALEQAFPLVHVAPTAEAVVACLKYSNKVPRSTKRFLEFFINNVGAGRVSHVVNGVISKLRQ